MTYKRRITGTNWLSHQPTIPVEELDGWFRRRLFSMTEEEQITALTNTLKAGIWPDVPAEEWCEVAQEAYRRYCPDVPITSDDVEQEDYRNDQIKLRDESASD
jgi:hypothetical protein